MKRILFISILLIIGFWLHAQIPQAINFQAIARDTLGNPMVNTDIQIQLSVLDSAQGGSVIYQELRALQTNAYGSFSFQIGVDPQYITAGTFQDIDWVSGNKHLKIDYDPTNTFTFNLTLGIIKFVTVPYAFATRDVVYIDPSGAQDGDALVYNSGTGKFEAQPLVADAVTQAQFDSLLAVVDTIKQYLGLYGSVTDLDGNSYNTVKIGSQIWMKSNLNVSKLNNGTAIPNIPNGDSTDWYNLTTPGYCWYDGEESNGNIYGKLYNWYTVNTGAICPTGWHVPSNDDWTVLTNYLGGDTLAGGKMKEAGTAHWESPNSGANNTSGFTALPGGRRSNSGNFYQIGESGLFWSSDQATSSNGYLVDLYYQHPEIRRGLSTIKKEGASVRCIKD